MMNRRYRRDGPETGAADEGSRVAEIGEEVVAKRRRGKPESAVIPSHNKQRTMMKASIRNSVLSYSHITTR
jgi:hypothetical protein